MPLPLLWRRADISSALSRAGASAFIVSGRVGGHDQLDDALQAAVETFHIRAVCSFGQNVPDGVVALSDLFAAEALDPLPPAEERPYPPGPAAHLAAVTWDVGADGAIPVARSHAELAAGGLAVLLESRLRAGRDHPHHLDDGLVRGPLHRAAAVAAGRRHAGAAPPVRSGRLRRSAALGCTSMRWCCRDRWSRN